jgi:hypothetical protein
LNSISLSKNILKAIQAYRGDMPTLDAFPKAHQVTFKYYVGVIYFLEENYEEVRQRNMSNNCQDANPLQSEKHLTEAWQMCHKDAIRNKE